MLPRVVVLDDDDDDDGHGGDGEAGKAVATPTRPREDGEVVSLDSDDVVSLAAPARRRTEEPRATVTATRKGDEQDEVESVEHVVCPSGSAAKRPRRALALARARSDDDDVESDDNDYVYESDADEMTEATTTQVSVPSVMSVDCLEILDVTPEQLRRCYMLATPQLLFTVEKGVVVNVQAADDSPVAKAVLRALRGKRLDYDELARALKATRTTCLACNAPLSTRAYRPGLCARDLCRFSAGALGVGSTLEWELKHSPEVVALVTSLLHAAVQNDEAWRHEDELLRLDPDLKRLMSESRHDPRTALRGATAEPDSPLLRAAQRWLMASLPVVVSHAPEFAAIVGSRQAFLLQRHDLDVERDFDAEVAEHGSFFAFTGSAMSRWLAILRLGLRVLSGTSLQKNGAAYGPGIYTATHAATALGYAQGALIGLVEIINRPQSFKVVSGGGIIVVNDATAIRVRALLHFGSEISLVSLAPPGAKSPTTSTSSTSSTSTSSATAPTSPHAAAAATAAPAPAVRIAEVTLDAKCDEELLRSALGNMCMFE